MIRVVDPEAARAALHGDGEVAFLDVREAGQFGEGHPLFAVPCPFSRLEADAVRLVPRDGVPVLLLDDGDGVAERAAERLAALGYRDLGIVRGGAPGWAAAGHTLFKGVNVPTKTLGELAEAAWHPRVLSPSAYAELAARGEVRLFDARPPAEFAKMHVPGAVCLPNGELAHRLATVAPSADVPVVVGCAGRTRGIVGAVGLSLMGHDGPVYALENGTQGWTLDGRALVRGVAAEPYPALNAAALDDARRRADAFRAAWDIPRVAAADLSAMRAEAGRTTFVFDVRSAGECEADPVAAAPHAPGGQLVQALDQYVGVRRSRIVLADDTGVRAALAAFWLRQLGHEVAVVGVDDALRALPAAPPTVVPDDRPLPSVGAAEALERTAGGDALLVDLRSSRAHRAGRAAGAVWGIRPRLGHLARPDAPIALLVGDDPAAVAAVFGDLARAGRTDARVVDGGHAALVAVGAEIVADPASPDDDAAIDFLRFVHDRHDGNLDAARAYLAWETGLVAQLDEAERAEFRLARPRA